MRFNIQARFESVQADTGATSEEGPRGTPTTLTWAPDVSRLPIGSIISLGVI